MKARPTKGEGWDVFQSDGSTDGPMQICKIDDPNVSIQDSDSRVKRNPNVTFSEAFRSDAGAIKHVLRLAKRGNVEALDALWLALPHDGLLNRILWCEALGWSDPAYPVGYFEKWGHLYEEL